MTLLPTAKAPRLGRISFFLLALVTQSFGGRAYGADYLTGLRSIQVNVNILGDAKGICRPDVDRLRQALLLPIRAYTKLQVVAEGQSPQATANMYFSVQASDDFCVATMSISCVSTVVATLGHHHEPRVLPVDLFQYVASRAVSSHLAQSSYERSLEVMGKAFATAWQDANPN